ncbi:MAG: hypothetical protein LH702_33855 [Phormidesmis sp. CAN_BIN44]|nr:hypothetical protein [Phormidesmis sp. CAN_BIN44]
MKSTLAKVNQSLWDILDKASKKSDPHVRSVALSSSQANNASVWFSFKDGSGCLQRYYAKEGIYVPLISEVGGLLVSSLSLGFSHDFSTHWATHYIYLLDENSKRTLGLAMSSAYDYNLENLIREIEDDVSIAEAASDNYVDDDEEY